MLRKFCKKNNTIFLNIDSNIGKSNAVAFGMTKFLESHRNVQWVGFLDSDGAFSVKDVSNIINLTKGAKTFHFDAIYSSRVKLAGRNINRGILRHYLSRIISTIFGFAWPAIPYDTQSGFKLYKNNTQLRDALSHLFMTRWFFDIELHTRISVKDNQFEVWEEPVSTWSDMPNSKINFRQGLKLIKEVFFIFNLLIKKRI
jgi:hypothetical protein